MDPSQNKGPDKLVSFALSDKTQIITTDDVPNEKSLADFARAMGFDEAQVASLFGPHAAQTMISNPKPNPSTSLNASASALEQNKSSLTASLGNSGLQSVLTLTESSAGTGTLANPLSKLPTAPEHGSMNTMNLLGTPLAIDSNLQMGVSPMPAQSVLTGLPGQALMTKSSQGTSTSAVNLAQLMSSEGIDPQGVQLNISTPIKNASASLNSALGGPSNSNMPSTSTLAVLNMTGSKLSENAIAALQKEFNQLRGLDKHEEKTSAFGIASSFDTTLSVSTSLQAGEAGNTSGNPSDGSSSGQNGTQNTQNTGSTVNMAETYEKLSEQLTAELSKRMHEQISQGQWKMKFALKPSTLGAVDVQLEMKDGKLAAVFQADNALTQNLLQHSSQQLKDNLKDLGLDQTYVQVDQQNAGQSQHNDQQNNGKNPFDAVSDAQSLANAQDSTPVVDASMKVKNNDSLLDLMA
jgi:flagellar hook-length control protein FliK